MTVQEWRKQQAARDVMLAARARRLVAAGFKVTVLASGALQVRRG